MLNDPHEEGESLDFYLHYETEKAWLVSDEQGADDEEKAWLPKSQCDLEGISDDAISLWVPEWLLDEKGLDGMA